VSCINAKQGFFGVRLKNGARESSVKRLTFGRSVKEIIVVPHIVFQLSSGISSNAAR
jgi:hypothetical protein